MSKFPDKRRAPITIRTVSATEQHCSGTCAVAIKTVRLLDNRKPIKNIISAMVSR